MAIRPLAEGRPSTDGPLQIKSVPSNVNTYTRIPFIDRFSSGVVAGLCTKVRYVAESAHFVLWLAY